jgi:hypothetical protein
MKFEVLMAVYVSLLVFWVIPSCGLVGRYHCFGGTTALIFRAEGNLTLVS